MERLACVSPGNRDANTITVPAGSARTLRDVPLCNLVGGGSQFNPSGFKVTKTVKNGNGWRLDVRNTTGSSNTIGGTAICLTGAPTNAQVSSIQGNVVNVTPGSFGARPRPVRAAP